MSTISKPYTFSPNTTASSSQVNADFDTIYNDYNGNISAANLATGAVSTAKIADGAVTTDKLNDASVTNAKLAANAAWTSWTPTLTNITQGNGTVTAKYSQIGKVVFFKFFFVLGSTSAMGSIPTISLPVTAAALVSGSDNKIDGKVEVKDASTGDAYTGEIFLNSTTVARPTYLNVNAVNVNISATAPMTWATSDVLGLAGSYEAA